MFFWTIKDITDVTRLSESTIRRMVKDQIFPAPFKLIGRRKVWKPDDVRAWADSVTNGDPVKADKSTSWFSHFA
tara:strand:+ start:100 stop:321 length:222 start_codon:yes stop_codon:yes gene_type:complete